MSLKFVERLINAIKSSITKKLILTYLMIVLIPISVSGIYILESTQENIKNEFFSIVVSQMDQLDRGIIKIIDLCSQNAGLIARDRNLISLLQNDDFSDYLLISTIMHDLIPKLQTMKGYSMHIYSLRVIHGNPKIPSVYDYIYYDKKFNNGIWSKSPESLKNKKDVLKFNSTYIEPSHEEPVYIEAVDKKRNKVFTLYTPIYTIYMDRIVGMVETSILEKTVFTSLEEINFKGYENINVIHRTSGKTLYSSNANFKPIAFDDIEKIGNFKTVITNGKKMHIAKKYIKSINSWLVVYIPADMLESKNSYKLILVAVFAVGLITLGIIAYFLSKLLLSKLVRLSAAMDVIKEGRFETRVDIKSYDEIGHLALNFNEMIDRINFLMNNLDKASKAEKEAIYKALENQINPHFLCNALEMIRMTAELHDDREVSNAAELIANYLMYIVKRKDRYVSLRDEVKTVTEYLGIYNLIKNNRIHYSINVCDELSGRLDEYQVLKFILQPVVENSLKHGFASMKKNCRIVINIGYGDNTVTINIEDNGVGICEQRLEELKEYLNPGVEHIDFKTSGSGIGLRNINERLVLNYGSEYGLVIESAEGYGTSVTIRIPVINNRKE